MNYFADKARIPGAYHSKEHATVEQQKINGLLLRNTALAQLYAWLYFYTPWNNNLLLLYLLLICRCQSCLFCVIVELV